MQITEEERKALLEALQLGAWVVEIECGPEDQECVKRAIAILKP